MLGKQISTFFQEKGVFFQFFQNFRQKEGASCARGRAPSKFDGTFRTLHLESLAGEYRYVRTPELKGYGELQEEPLPLPTN